VLLLALIALEAWSKPAVNETLLNIDEKTALKDLLDNLDDNVLTDEDDEKIKPEDSPDSSSSSRGSRLANGVRVCLRLRLLRMLFRLFMLKSSGFNIQQLLKGNSTDSVDTSPNKLGLSQTEMMDICSDLCALGTCPPGCPGNNQPPWGQGR